MKHAPIGHFNPKRANRGPRLLAGLVAAGVAVLLGACGTLPRNAVPTEMMAEATIPGMPDVRAAAGQQSAAMTRDFEASFAQERPEDFPRAPTG